MSIIHSLSIPAVAPRHETESSGCCPETRARGKWGGAEPGREGGGGGVLFLGPMPAAAPSPPSAGGAAREEAEGLLGSEVVCTLDDGRTLTGTLRCLDRLGNVVLSDATEVRTVARGNYGAYLAGAPAVPSCQSGGSGDGDPVRVERALDQAVATGARLVKVEVARRVLREGGLDGASPLPLSPPPSREGEGG